MKKPEPTLLKHSHPALPLVEQRISAAFTSAAPILSEISHYLLKLGGKRLRPLLTLYSSTTFGGHDGPPTVIAAAAAIELLHMATLLHDDIIDHAAVRRHHSSPLQRYGSGPTLLAGDFLLVRAFGLASNLPEGLIAATEAACVELTEGEVLETPLSTTNHSPSTVQIIAEKKTAALFELALRAGAHLNNVSNEVEVCSATSGRELGIAFQYLDDILDVTASVAELGKPPGTDLRERKPSIVNVLWLQSEDREANFLLQAASPSDEDRIAKALIRLRDSNIITTAQDIARRHADRAAKLWEQALLAHRPNPVDYKAAEAVQELIAFTVDRCC